MKRSEEEYHVHRIVPLVSVRLKDEQQDDGHNHDVASRWKIAGYA